MFWTFCQTYKNSNNNNNNDNGTVDELFFQATGFHDGDARLQRENESVFWLYANFSQINAHHTFLHDLFISVWILSMFYIQKMQ